MSELSMEEKIRRAQRNHSQNYVMEPERTSSFQFRFFLAVLLLAAVILMDKNNIKVAGITMRDIQKVISADYEDKLELWVNNYKVPVK